MRTVLSTLCSLLALQVSAVAQDWLVDPTPYVANVVSSADEARIVLQNGLVRRVFTTQPTGATIALDLFDLPGQTQRSLLRTVKPEARLVIDGETVWVGGVQGLPLHNYFEPEWIPRLQPLDGSLRWTASSVEPLSARFAWSPRLEWMSRPAVWPPKGVMLTMTYAGAGRWQGVRVVVEHECYDGLPLLAKRVILHNETGRDLRVQQCVSEILGVVEAETDVEPPQRVRYPQLHVESDAAALIRPNETLRQASVRWLPDPDYTTQVNYAVQAPCLLESAAPFGPDVVVAAGRSFESHRTWILPFDTEDTQRRALTLARFYRTVAPWTQENPLLFHAASSEPSRLRAALDQAADAGFEMVIMTFGSGANLESRDPAYLATMKTMADYAHQRGLAVGGYSLLASRSVSPETDVIDPATLRPGGAYFGNSPCLASAWGRDYLAAVRGFFEATGMDVLEHDGSYPGDVCASTTHAGHRGLGDSYWMQRAGLIDLYRWARGRGIYLNVPDWHFLNGSSKAAMGYRETNWSLPREHQEIIERQNIADGVRTKSVTMGWMFVPLMEYHGGGAAATIEPLHEHRDHYRMRLRNLLGAGVQACWRGPRLYDTPETREMLVRELTWFKANRRILESDLVLLRRADGADWDGWLHVDPAGDTQGLAMLYNPRPVNLTRQVRLPLRYTGLQGRVQVEVEGQRAQIVAASADGWLELQLELPARGSLWVKLARAP